MIKRIDGHTVDLSLLRGKGVIDLGCRGFVFAKYFMALGHDVVAFDADKDVFKNTPKGIIGVNQAVTTYNGETTYYKLGECGYTNDIKEHNPDESVKVACMPYADIMDKDYDILKMDIEGAEYAILSDPNFKPLPKQITVEFHEHVFPELHKEMFQRCLTNLSQWYDLVYTMKENEFEFIDVLFVRR